MDRIKRPRVVIVGGGFAGLFAARALRRSPVEVTLVDRAEHHLFVPLLYQCATGILSEGQIAAPLRDVLKRHRNTEYLLAEVVDLDPPRRCVVAERPGGELVELPYDYVVLAAGVRQSYFGHDEFAAWAPGLKTLADALDVRARVFGAFERAESATDSAERRRWLTFALVGAGPTGVELAGQIRELADRTLRAEFRRIRPEDARVLLFDGGRAPLVAFGPDLSAKAAQALTALGVELHLGSVVTHVDQEGLLVRGPSGVTTEYPAATVLWTAGVEAPPLAAAVAKATGACRDRAGRIRVGADLTVPGHPEILVAGDLMSRTGLPGVAEVAMQAGHYAGRRIRQQVAGRRAARAFHYVDLGSAAYIARGRAVVSAGRLHLSGPVAWVVWLFVHIAFLTGFRNRLGAVLTWSLAFTRGIRRERAFTTHMIDTRRDVYALPGAARRPGKP
ncbi:NAD(P)/FAD-dependent oxidoreductase [Pseudonocardia acidicola]|uniref:NAD(P)/FAD-dependent oxidoreductase n=1 Tax=Pseudonocardia acidicola TaxID=2724939 RepID=A0ABX1S5Q0_9PSEU|nr:NAD(P)/FAD-dependent oxidoreductase [Pseudonocardia acidicola]NMH96227.1 NAD(P)/FAD-dependent oxidoreductase [Pseudonocardia acidicola]